MSLFLFLSRLGIFFNLYPMETGSTDSFLGAFVRVLFWQARRTWVALPGGVHSLRQ